MDEVYLAMVGDIAMLEPTIIPSPKGYKSAIELFTTAKEGVRKGGRRRVWGVLDGVLRDQRVEQRRRRRHTEREECSACEGTGLYAKRCWDSPEIVCDECGGSGG